MSKMRITLVIILTLLLGNEFSAVGQNKLTQIPIDNQIRYGQLPNGLTYYIRKNQEPRERADFYIAQKVGSVLEEDSQRGLAHFLEHLAFNGTKNFPEKTMLNYLETIGAKFGANVNAYTSFDETVYNLSDIPTTRNGILDSCVLILHDWSSAISLNEEEIEKERKVIIEEWRTRRTGPMRQIEQLLPLMYPGSRYAERMPIGDTSVIANFKPEEIRDYYKKWYRPDLQGIVIVGDFDPDEMEERVKSTFADIPKPVNPAERVYYPVPDNEDPIVAIASDKEANTSAVTIYYKHNPAAPEVLSSVTGLIMNYIKSISTTMLNARLEELLQKANPPFIGAATYIDNYFVSKTKHALVAAASCSETQIEKAELTLLEELQRVKLHGFTSSEYDRARTDFLSSFENLYNERGKRKNSSFIGEYVDHFLHGGYIPGIETEYEINKKIAAEISVEQISQLVQNYITERNVVISVRVPEKEGYTPPSPEDLIAHVEMIKDYEVEPYLDFVLDQPLVGELPNPGTIVNEESDQRYGTTLWTLSNGAKVVIKQTDFKEDEIVMKGISLGGNSLVANSNLPEINAFDDVINLGGLGNFTAIEVQKLLTGKRASASLSLDRYSESVNAACSPKDLEAMMQLVYLNLTAPRKDIEAFQSYTSRLADYLKNMEANPRVAFRDSITKTVYDNNPRMKALKAADIKHINYDALLRIQRDRFKYACDFTYIFIGNIDIATLRPLVEQYVGSLRGVKTTGGSKQQVLSFLKKARKEDGMNEMYKDLGVNVEKGSITNHFSRKMETPQVSVFKMYSGKTKYNLRNLLLTDMLDNLLDIVYTEKVREDEGGTYGVGVSSGLSSLPQKDYLKLQLSFDTNEEVAEKLITITHNELMNIAQNGPRGEDFAKVKEYMLKQHAQNLRSNGYWMTALTNEALFGIDNMSQYETVLKAIKQEEFKLFVKNLMKQKNSIEVVMQPQK